MVIQLSNFRNLIRYKVFKIIGTCPWMSIIGSSGIFNQAY